MSVVNDYFGRFLPGKAGVPLLAGYERYCMDFVIAFRDTGRRWAVTVRDGSIARVAEADDPSAHVCFVVDEAVFAEIVAGRVSPQKAFFARRTDIRGNLVAGMKLAKILALFFAQHPYRPRSR